MNKNEFLKNLKRKLGQLKTSEVTRYISYYEEMICDMTEHEMSEDEAVKEIGTPEAIAEAILKDAASEEFKRKDTAGICLIAISSVLLILSLIFSWSAHSLYSLSFIGEADGPTSIFIAGKTGRISGLYILTAVFIFITIAYKLFRHRR